MVHTGYNPALVLLSIAIAVFASYAALDLGARVRRATEGPRWSWIAGAAIAMGGGIWAMHFVGMLAFEMGLPAAYDLKITLLSLVIAVGVTAGAFAWVAAKGTGIGSLLVAGPLMGVGVAAMHYTGMAAMRVAGNFAYDPAIVAVSVAIAVTAATAALWLAFRQNNVWQKLLAACVMGLAVAGMHYTGMAAATFTAQAAGAQPAHATVLGANQANLALSVAGVTFVILFLAMMAGSLDQRRTQRRLHVSEARFRSAVQAVRGVMWTADVNGNFIEEQPGWEAITGQAFDEYRGDGWLAAAHPDDRSIIEKGWAEAVRTGTPYIADQRLRSSDGIWRHYHVQTIPVRDPNGTIREWVGVHEDVTERHAYETALREARDDAEEASQAKSQFLANMSHELRTPLSAIIGYAELLLEEVEDGAAAEDLTVDIKKIEGNARHLLGLINDVLDLSKVESGKMDVYAETFDVANVVEDVVATAKTLAEKKGNRLVLEIAADAGSMNTDITKLRQILLNLLSNAAKFTQDGKITLTMTRQGEMALFRVSDTGIGMSPEQLERLFQRFSQADASTTRRFGGTGLGLALTKAFSAMLGGEVTVESRQNEGSTFTLRLPVVYAEPASAPAEVPSIAAQPPADMEVEPGKAVLVVDDDPAQRELMTRFLAREGFATLTAGDGETGLAMAKEMRPRAILLDVMMPGMDGWTVLSRLKADPDLAAIPVVMVTLVNERSLASSLGAVDYVPKPVRWEEFRQVMDRFRDEAGDVLVVDDDQDARDRVRHALERDGWTVAEAGNGQEALDKVAIAPPRVILLDLTMPVMDGFTFLHSLRERPGGRDIPVIVLSARALTPQDRQKLQSAVKVIAKGAVSLRDVAVDVRNAVN
nr:MHYT domain-containing protein [Aureimonas endophytica]